MGKADLHIHSCLSPCASLDMGPIAIIEKCLDEKITHFSITDHNSCRNLPAFYKLSQKEKNLTFIPGIEVTSSEEAHILCYFNTLENAMLFGAEIENSLMKIPLNEDKMGYQVVVDKYEDVIDMLDFYLNMSSSYSISEIVERASYYGGFVIPAHINKPLYSIISQIGFITTDDNFSGMEISGAIAKDLESYVNKTPNLSNFSPILTSSDSHYLDNIGDHSVNFDDGFDIVNINELLDYLRDNNYWLE